YVGDIKRTATSSTAATAPAFLAIAAIGISSTAAPACAVRDSGTAIFTALDFASKEYVGDYWPRRRRDVRRIGSGHSSWHSQRWLRDIGRDWWDIERRCDKLRARIAR